jgi:hypothetical protein
LRESAEACFECDASLAEAVVIGVARMRGGRRVRTVFCLECRPPRSRSFACDGGCGRDVHGLSVDARVHVCSTRCKSAHYSAIRRDERRAVRGLTRVCEQCGEEFEPTRADQRFCPGGACKQRAYRRRREHPLLT